MNQRLAAAILGLGLPEFIVIAVIILVILFLRRGGRWSAVWI